MFLIFLLITISLTLALDPPYGQLKISGQHLTNSAGTSVQLRGLSLAWSHWYGSLYQNITVKSVKCTWNANVIRAAMGVDSGGYATNPETEYKKIKTVIEAAIEHGIYVIVDFHHDKAYNYENTSIQFFKNISTTYGSYPHIIYEIINEPTVTWSTIKTYAEHVIDAIRANDPDNVIIVGTPNYSTDVDVAANDTISGSNIAYSLHYYAPTQGQWNRDKATKAMNSGVALFVSQYGVATSSQNGTINETAAREWWDFLDTNKISYVYWSIYPYNSASAALKLGTTANQINDFNYWTNSTNGVAPTPVSSANDWTYGAGTLINNMLKSKDQGVSCSFCNGGGVWSEFNTWSSCYKNISTTEISSCGGTMCGVQTSTRTCKPVDGCPLPTTCSGTNTTSKPCGVTSVCSFPQSSCCSGFVRTADSNSKTFLCVPTEALSCTVYHNNLKIYENDLAQVLGPYSSCCQHCEQTAGCKAYSWNNGTCYLKKDTQPLVNSSYDYTGMLKPTTEENYVLKKSYNSTGFFDYFDFATQDWSLIGYTNFTTRAVAESLGLIKTQNGKIYIGVENTTVLPADSARGRPAVRVESKAKYNSGLFIFSIDRMPVGAGTWPAFWTFGPSWPTNGEIDVLEMISTHDYNSITLHTRDNCAMQAADQQFFKGTWNNNKKNVPGTNCYINDTDQYYNAGCGIQAPKNTANYGFNQAGGGVFAMEWIRDKFIRVWNFVKPNIPADIANNSPNPNPSLWGMPDAHFIVGPNCTADHFKDQVIVINTGLCGWANEAFNSNETACREHVRNNPSNFTDAYFLINYLNYYCMPNDPYCTL